MPTRSKQNSGLKPRAHLIDTASCVQFCQDLHPDHRPTRAQDVAAKQDLMRFFRARGVVPGSENAADFGAAWLDYPENRHAQVGLAEMTAHRHLTEDGLVEQTEFSSGQSAIVNFAREPRTVAGKTIPPEGVVTLA